MAISNVVARGFGSFGGGANKLPTRGFGIGAAPAVTTFASVERSAIVSRTSSGTAAISRSGEFYAEVSRAVEFYGEVP